MSDDATKIDIEFHLKNSRRRESMLEKLDGYKTYIVAVAMICYAVGGIISGYVQWQQAIEVVLLALGVFGLKHSNEKVDAKLTEIMKPGV